MSEPLTADELRELRAIVEEMDRQDEARVQNPRVVFTEEYRAAKMQWARTVGASVVLSLLDERDALAAERMACERVVHEPRQKALR